MQLTRLCESRLATQIWFRSIQNSSQNRPDRWSGLTLEFGQKEVSRRSKSSGLGDFPDVIEHRKQHFPVWRFLWNFPRIERGFQDSNRKFRKSLGIEWVRDHQFEANNRLLHKSGDCLEQNNEEEKMMKKNNRWPERRAEGR
jgi:hypothetical protein